jgi:ribonuclease VapC
LIAIDSSALLAILLEEEFAAACAGAIADQTELIISATVLAESFIVARGYGVLPNLQEFLDGIQLEIVPSDAATAARIVAIYGKWGRRNHPAKLNIIDCFSYDVARQHNCPLLFIGNGFTQTDIVSALTL